MKVLKEGAILENNRKDFFSTDLDSYSGSSGSPVINVRTGLVEGILVRGQEDFIEKNGCSISYVCRGSICLGEEALRASVASKILSKDWLLEFFFLYS